MSSVLSFLISIRTTKTAELTVWNYLLKAHPAKKNIFSIFWKFGSLPTYCEIVSHSLYYCKFDIISFILQIWFIISFITNIKWMATHTHTHTHTHTSALVESEMQNSTRIWSRTYQVHFYDNNDNSYVTNAFWITLCNRFIGLHVTNNKEQFLTWPFYE